MRRSHFLLKHALLEAWCTPCTLAKRAISANHCGFDKTHTPEHFYSIPSRAGGIRNLIRRRQSNQPPFDLIKNAYRSLITTRKFCTVNHERRAENVQALHGNLSAGCSSNRWCRCYGQLATGTGGVAYWLKDLASNQGLLV